MNKIMLQGYLNSSNFGDMLFAHMFYQKCKELGFQKIDIFQYSKKHGISSFCRKELGYTEKKNLFSCLTADMLPAFEEKRELDTISDGRKKLLLHVHIPRDTEFRSRYMDMILPSVIDFLKVHKEYLLVLAQDSVFHVPEIEEIYKKLDDSGTEYYKYQYHDCLQMASLINETDCIVTVKLHTGVVGCALGKSVIAFPAHRDKVDNFYTEIGDPERCCNLKRLTREIADRQLKEFYDKPVVISDELREKAVLNLEVLCEIIQ